METKRAMPKQKMVKKKTRRMCKTRQKRQDISKCEVASPSCGRNNKERTPGGNDQGVHMYVVSTIDPPAHKCIITLMGCEDRKSQLSIISVRTIQPPDFLF